jgi:NAD(P)-dependent dehydrogenase (short-subunit alcohol dehydrogenase family)
MGTFDLSGRIALITGSSRGIGLVGLKRASVRSTELIKYSRAQLLGRFIQPIG